MGERWTYAARASQPEGAHNELLELTTNVHKQASDREMKGCAHGDAIRGSDDGNNGELSDGGCNVRWEGFGIVWD
jgi:hypothetical protein